MRILTPMVIACAALASSAAAAPLTASQIMTQFNAVVNGSFSGASDVEGRLVANQVAGGATFYSMPSGTASSFGAINAITIANFSANINNGGAVDYQTSDAAHFNLNGGGTVSRTPWFAMTDFSAPLNALEAQLGGLAGNSAINAADLNNFTFNVSPNASGTAIFNLSTATLATARNRVFSGSASTIIINLTGSTFNDLANFNTSTLDNSVIWNFVDATSLSFAGWHGAVLAGDASVTNSSAMEGFLYAQNLTGGGELHDRPFSGTLPVVAVPEPSGYATWGVGLLGLMLLRRRRRRSPAFE